MPKQKPKDREKATEKLHSETTEESALAESLRACGENALRLQEWFGDHARVLPWRSDPTPYHVWISEIMLQQTRVEAVKPYYARFMEELPDVAALAACPEEKYLKLWEGLGYYSRVRNLHAAAEQIMEEYGGVIPSDPGQLMQLKGIGSYTAGAIASIAYGKAAPAVDGNVLRVIMRLTGCRADIAEPRVKAEVEKALLPWLAIEEILPGRLNQALMELGAIVCLPNGAPHCGECPWQASCRTCEEQSWESIPVKSAAKARKTEERTVLVLENQEGYYFDRRPGKGLLAGLFELPNEAGHLTEEEVLKLLEEKNLKAIRIRPLPPAKHIFSHIEWHMIGYHILVEQEAGAKKQSPLPQRGDGKPAPGEWFFIDAETAGRDYAIPSAFKAYVSYLTGYGND